MDDERKKKINRLIHDINGALLVVITSIEFAKTRDKDQEIIQYLEMAEQGAKKIPPLCNEITEILKEV